MRKMQPAITDLLFSTDFASQQDNRCFIDTAKALSKVNRRLYEQGRLYGYNGLSYVWRGSPADASVIEVSVRTAGNTWMVHNAFVKGKALWHEMQQLVLDDNPSIKGKWHDFKVQLSAAQTDQRTLDVTTTDGTAVLAGEWALSEYVMPQHDVDPATGEPLTALKRTAVLIGDDSASGSRISLVKAYQDSRATVQPLDPNVPADMSTSFFNLLTDSGSQEPELADVIEDENDAPPYDTDAYPGGDGNSTRAYPVQYSAISAQEVDGRIGGFVAPCGLLEIAITAYDADGVAIGAADTPDIDILLHVAPGPYKGVAAIPMGQ